MTMDRALITATLAMLVAATAHAEFDVPEWESIGPDGVAATGLFWSDWHGVYSFLSSPEGYQVYHAGTQGWTDFTEPGVPGREVTALTMVPRLEHRVLTGRLGDDGHGSIEMAFPLKNGDRDLVVYAGLAGAVFAIVNRAFYDPILYAGTRALGETPGALIATADSGLTWQEMTGHGHHDLTDIVCYYNDILYVSGDAGVMYTEDGGATWQPRNDGLPAGTVTHLWIDGPGIVIPDKGERDVYDCLFAAMADGVYYTTTDVVQWQRILADPSPRQILVQSDAPPVGNVYVVTGDGRLLASQRGQWEWTDLTGSLTGEDIVGARLDYPHLSVATSAAGLYRSARPTGSTDVPAADAPLQLTVAPNPFNPRTTVSFTLSADGAVVATIHDARGMVVSRLVDATLAAGQYDFAWEGRNAGGAALPSGTYFCRLSTPWGVETRKMGLVR